MHQRSLTEGGRLSKIDLLVLVRLEELVCMLKIFFTFFVKYTTLMRRSIVLSLPIQIVFPVHF
jgi:hypothetical protein